MGGYNPMRWDCAKNGCYNKKLRPRIEEFADCFPGKIGMSDVDGVVEISGHFLFLEWKAEGGSVSTGQRIMYERLTALSDKMTVIVVNGHPRTMEIKQVQVYRAGKGGPFEACSFDELKMRMKCWVARVRSNG